MSHTFNPFTEKLDYFFPATSGFGRFKFLGTTADDATDPGYGNMKFDLSGEGLGETFSAIFSIKDLDGSAFYSLPQLISFGIMEDYHIWLYVHSKNDPKMCAGMLITDMEAIVDLEDNTLAFQFPVLPWIWPIIWAEDWDEWVSRDFIDGEDVIVSWDFAFNPEYVGSLGTQDAGDVSIYGGDIGGVNINLSAKNIQTDTETGSKIGTGADQLLGFYGATPVDQPDAVADATGAGDVVAQLNLLLARMRELGLIAT